jgi:hypothetical protein
MVGESRRLISMNAGGAGFVFFLNTWIAGATGVKRRHNRARLATPK